MSEGHRREESLEKIAKEYHSASHEDMFIENLGQEHEWPWISSFIAFGDNVLDLGYGDGVSLKNLALDHETKNISVTLIEGAPTLVKEAIARAPQEFEIVHSFFEEFERPSTFDVILASHVLEHVDHPVELLLNLSKSMKASGKIVGVVPNAQSIHRELAVIMGLQDELDVLSKRDLMVGHQRVYKIESLEADLVEAGFRLVSIRGFFLKPFSNKQLTSFDSSVIEALNIIAERLPPSICANLGFVAEKE